METKRQAEYRVYLESEHWKKLRGVVISRDGRCLRCGSRKPLQAHHRFYRSRWEDSIPEDLETLCRGCHRAVHGISEREVKDSPVVWNWKLLHEARSRKEISRSDFERIKLLLGFKKKRRKKRLIPRKKKKPSKPWWFVERINFSVDARYH